MKYLFFILLLTGCANKTLNSETANYCIKAFNNPYMVVDDACFPNKTKTLR